jgi:hypothetical protein
MKIRKGLKITQCRDGMRWYAGHVGEVFPLLATFRDEYKTREPAGYSNFIVKDDCKVVDMIEEAVPVGETIH